ncbi:unnamed protein product [Agarophyton chilense]
MVYDPFGSNADNAENAPAHRLVSVRRPPICNAQLSPLEWGITESRKRKRPNGIPPADQTHIRSAPPPAPKTKSATEHSEKRETIRYVEKIVSAQPLTIMGVPPVVDDRILHVIDFILQYVTSQNVEIEVKLGLLLAKETGKRVKDVLPVKCETSISPETNNEARFESNVGDKVFSMLNQALNKRVEATQQDSNNKVQYNRLQHLDVYWPGRIRETKELRSSPDGSEYYQTIRVQSKTRLADINFLCPMHVLDMRYSASLEQDANIPPNTNPLRQRVKDRISYKYEYLSVDIASVTLKSMNNQDEGQQTFEVEVEIDPSANLFEEVTKHKRGDKTSKLLDIATCLVNTVRILREEQ